VIPGALDYNTERMDTSAIDFTALVVGVVVAGFITAVFAIATPTPGRRRIWLAAAAITAVLMAVGLADLLRETPRETHVATVILGASLPVLGAVGMIAATRRVRPLSRWALVFVTALALLFVGMFVGAALVPRYLGG
jgi:hypothetical protein